MFSDSKLISEKLISLRAHGKGKSKYEISEIGLNSRLDSIQAAILLAKMKIFNWELKERNDNLQEYYDILTDREKLRDYIEENYSSLPIATLTEIDKTIENKIEFKAEYILYIQQYGLPVNGIFDPLKIAQIKSENNL